MESEPPDERNIRYNAYAGTALAGGATTNGQKTITVTSTANAYVGAEISGAGIPAGTFIKSVDSATALTLSKAATATAAGVALTISGQGNLPTTYATYVKAQATFGVADLDAMAAAFDNNFIPTESRFAALTSSYYRRLGTDNQITALLQASNDLSYISKRELPPISSFQMLNAPWFPSSANRVGFVGHKAAAVIKTCLPQSLTQALPGTPIPGNTATITDPATGISLALVSYYNLQGGFAEWRPELMAGVAVGDRRAGLVVTSA